MKFNGIVVLLSEHRHPVFSLCFIQFLQANINQITTPEYQSNEYNFSAKWDERVHRRDKKLKYETHLLNALCRRTTRNTKKNM